MNLYEETIRILNNNLKGIEDVRAVIIRSRVSIDVKEFFETAKTIDYDSGYGTNEIHEGLMVVGDDWWLARCEYDGSEWWEYRTLPSTNLPPLKGNLRNAICC